jgi:hypothetical protein
MASKELKIGAKTITKYLDSHKEYKGLYFYSTRLRRTQPQAPGSEKKYFFFLMNIPIIPFRGDKGGGGGSSAL